MKTLIASFKFSMIRLWNAIAVHGYAVMAERDNALLPAS